MRLTAVLLETSFQQAAYYLTATKTTLKKITVTKINFPRRLLFSMR